MSFSGPPSRVINSWLTGLWSAPFKRGAPRWAQQPFSDKTKAAFWSVDPRPGLGAVDPEMVSLAVDAAFQAAPYIQQGVKNVRDRKTTSTPGKATTNKVKPISSTQFKASTGTEFVPQEEETPAWMYVAGGVALLAVVGGGVAAYKKYGKK